MAHKLRVTVEPGVVREVDDAELVDLARQGLIHSFEHTEAAAEVLDQHDLKPKVKSWKGAERGGVAGSAVFATGDVFMVASAQRTDGWTPVQKGAGLADQPLAYRSASAAIRYAPDLGSMKLALRASDYQESRDSGLAGAASRSVGASGSATLTGGSPGLGTDWRLQAWVRRRSTGH